MSKLSVVTLDGGSAGDVDFADDLLVLDRGDQAMQDAIVAYRANQRAGTASTKTKGEVRGSNRKLWKQKGTGRARTGYRQSPIWRGGGVAFGPRPRDFSKKMTKKAQRLAFARAFSEKVQGGDVVVVDDISMSEPKTSTIAALTKADAVGKTAILVVDKLADNVALSVRNIPHMDVTEARELNTYEVIRFATIIVTRSAMSELEDRLRKVTSSRRSA